MAKKMDLYPNVITKQVTQSAADTLTFEEIDIGLNIFDKVALVMHRFSIIPTQATMVQLQTDADSFSVAITASDDITNLQMTNVEVYDSFFLQSSAVGTAASALVFDQPYEHDFSGMPGGGLLLAPRPLYVGMDSDDISTPGVCRCRIHFTIIPLADADYIELIQTRRAFT